jgi:multidrug efflux pump subunit AcrA (membrane-fusion protein)
MTSLSMPEPAPIALKSLLSQTKRPLLLPGTILPLEQAKVYSRANGYVTAWHADMGDHVAAGELLAEERTDGQRAFDSYARARRRRRFGRPSRERAQILSN